MLPFPLMPFRIEFFRTHRIKKYVEFRDEDTVCGRLF